VEDGPLLPFVVFVEGNAMIDSSRTMKELLRNSFHSLYSWSAAYLAPLVFSFNDFLVMFSSSS
jgi:predicted transcriptional regulator